MKCKEKGGEIPAFSSYKDPLMPRSAFLLSLPAIRGTFLRSITYKTKRNAFAFLLFCEKRDLGNPLFRLCETGRIATRSAFLLSHSAIRGTFSRSVSYKTKRNAFAFLLFCEKRDLNPYGVNHTPLKRARLPVPPLSHIQFVRRYRT